jgi:hypothetical protein
MVTLMMMVIFVMVVSRVFRRVIGEPDHGWHRARFRGRQARMRAMMEARESLRSGADESRSRVAPPPKVETPIESLQRRFAQGEMSMEQYEREVGELYGVKDN